MEREKELQKVKEIKEARKEQVDGSEFVKVPIDRYESLHKCFEECNLNLIPSVRFDREAGEVIQFYRLSAEQFTNFYGGDSDNPDHIIASRISKYQADEEFKIWEYALALTRSYYESA